MKQNIPAQQPIKNTQIDGDISVGRNVAMGGDASVQGDTLLKGNATIEGWLIAANVVSTHKGYFDSVEELKYNYQQPQDGWWCFVGNTLYVVHKGEWMIASGTFVQGDFEAMKTSFLSKLKPDETRHLLKLLGGVLVDGNIALLHQGAQFGKDFVSGLTGFGAKVDEAGHAEFESAFIRRFLEVPELRFNQVKVFVGVDWQCPGAGIIEKVTIDRDQQGNLAGTGVVKLKLENGQYGAVDVDDIVMGIYHTGGPQDATANKDDSKGNFAFAGFATAYFRVTAVSGAHNDTFSYALRPGTTIHPQPMMHFACYGNFTKLNRQQSTYRTPTYTRRLWNQNDWEIKKQNIAAQDGDLSNLSVHGMQMQGYSTYLNSVYFTGTIQQVKPDGTPVMTANDRGKWVAGKFDYYDRVSHMGRLWLCVSEMGTTQEPSLSSPDWLLQVDKGEDGESPYLVEILSSRGDKFHNGVVVTTLSATVFEGKVDITDTIPASRFSWTRSSSDKDGDKVWNQLHEGIGRYVDLTSDDVYRKAIFECLIII